MKYLGITYGMKRYPDSKGIEETAESYIELPISDENAERILKGRTSAMLEGIIDRICMLQRYYLDSIKKIEEVTLSG